MSVEDEERKIKERTRNRWRGGFSPRIKVAEPERVPSDFIFCNSRLGVAAVRTADTRRVKLRPYLGFPFHWITIDLWPVHRSYAW